MRNGIRKEGHAALDGGRSAVEGLDEAAVVEAAYCREVYEVFRIRGGRAVASGML